MSNEAFPKDDVFEQVQINFNVMDAWIDAICDIAVSFRLRQPSKPVLIESDAAFLAPTGTLTMITEVAGEPVRMVVPEDMWEWQKDDSSVRQSGHP